MPMPAASHCHPEKGFTLIELAIVLVIIGLLVGGILVGQDLIKAAEIHATISQLGEYDAAVDTFSSKYGGLPGDLPSTQATAYGLFALTGSGLGFGDGNGVIEDGNGGTGGPNHNYFAGEISTFWVQLSDANLVHGSYGSTGNSVLNPATGTVTGAVSNLSQSLPQAKVGSASISVISGGGYNYFAFLAIATILNSGAWSWNIPASPVSSFIALSPMTAHQIDAKLDDGMPNTGTVLAIGDPNYLSGAQGNFPAAVIGAAAPSVTPTAKDGYCEVGTALGDPTDTYNLDTSNGANTLSCQIAVRFN